MSLQDYLDARDGESPDGTVCPACKRVWATGCEQHFAVQLQNKCICCLTDAGEVVEWERITFAHGQYLKTQIEK